MVEVSGAAQAAPVTSVCSRDGEIAGRKSGKSGQVFVMGKNQKPLMPCHPARARELLKAGRAVIHRLFPLVIRLKDRSIGATQPVAVKLDPGSKTTGLAVVRLESLKPSNQHVLFLGELTHRGSAIRDALSQRAALRGARRGRKTRYRAPRFLNRGGDKKGWLPPSLRHRLETTAGWVARIRRFAPISALAMEIVRFDTQLLVNPEVTGAQYQQGELQGYEVREYLLEKWGRCCAYCDATDLPLQIEHIQPKARGGSDRIGNLTLACKRCNTDKAALDIREFLAGKQERLAKILAGAKAPLSDAAAVNATRHALYERLVATRLPVETATGGRTKWNRSRLGLPKTHALDAACVGAVDQLGRAATAPIAIKCAGRGSRQRTRLTAQGFPRGYLSAAKAHFGFRTGDIVTASVPSGQRQGRHFGRVAVRATGSFNIQTKLGTVQGIAHRFCSVVQRADGHAYSS
jgi:5-methylcytosine-specific restriction endonuclease McrA